MSRTDKDRPYWVKLNDTSDVSDHDHTLFGKKVYRSRKVRDDEGNPVMVSTPWGYPARTILYIISGKPAHIDGAKMAAILIQREVARELVQNGKDWEQVVCGYELRPKYEQYLFGTYADHCTEGEKMTDYAVGRNSQRLLPCTPALTGENIGAVYTYNKAGVKKSVSRVVYGNERNTERATLGAAARAWNSGEDIQDWDADTDLTGQHHHSMKWLLY